MANYFFNDQRNTSHAIELTLADLDSVTFGTGAVWAVMQGTCVQLTSRNRAFVYGQLYGSTGITVGGLTQSAVAVGAAGVISGTLYGIDASNAGVNLNNAGMISGQTAVLAGNAATIFNSGSIFGAADGTSGSQGIYARPAGAFSLTNTGSISAGSAVYVLGQSNIDIVNSGAIAGREYFFGGFAIYADTFGAAANLTNGGTIASLIELRGDSANFDNAGYAAGQVFLFGRERVQHSTTPVRSSATFSSATRMTCSIRARGNSTVVPSATSATIS